MAAALYTKGFRKLKREPIVQISEPQRQNGETITDPDEIRDMADRHIGEILHGSNARPRDLQIPQFLTKQSTKENITEDKGRREIGISNMEMAKSKRWYFLTRTNPDCVTILAKPITERERD